MCIRDRHYSRLPTNLCLLKPCFNFTDDPLKCLNGEFVFLCHSLGAESGSEENVEEKCGIELGLLWEFIVSFHNHKLLAQVSNILNNLDEDIKVRVPVIAMSLKWNLLEATLRGWRSVWPLVSMWKTFWAFQIRRLRLTGKATYYDTRDCHDWYSQKKKKGLKCLSSIHLTLLFPVGNTVLSASLSSFNCCHSASSSAWAVVDVSRSRTMSSLKLLRRCLWFIMYMYM